MIINIDETKRIKRLVIEFNDDFDDIDEIDISPKLNKSKSKPKTKKSDVSEITDNTETSENEIPLDLNFGNKKPSISNEIIEKPVIPDIVGEPNIAEGMQDLEI